MEDLVHQSAHAAEEHAADLGHGVDEIVEAISEGMRIEGMGVDELVIEVILALRPVVAPGKVNIPDDRLPFAGAIGVAVEIIILVGVVHVTVDLAGDEIVDHGGEVDLVVGHDLAGGQWNRGIDGVNERLQITVVFVLARFLLGQVGVAQIVVELVKGAVGIEAIPFQHAIVAILHHIHDAVKGAVALDPDREREMVRGGGAAGDLMGEGVAEPGFIGVIAEQIDVLEFAGGVEVPDEAVIGVEIEVIAFLGKPEAALAMEIDPDVIVEQVEIIKRGASAFECVGGRDILDELVEHGELRARFVRIHRDRAEIVIAVFGIEVCRSPAQRALGVGGLEPPAEHLAGQEGGGGECGGVDSVTRDRVGWQPIVPHGDLNLGIEHDSVGEPYGPRCQWELRGVDPDRHAVGGARGLAQRSRQGGSGFRERRPEAIALAVGGRGCGGDEIGGGAPGLFPGHLECRQDQEVRARDPPVQAMDREDVDARLKRADGDWVIGPVLIEVFEPVTGGPGIPGGIGRRVVGGHLESVEISDKPVVPAHAEAERKHG